MMLLGKLLEWVGKIIRVEFDKYMNNKFDEIINKLCPPEKQNNEKK